MCPEHASKAGAGRQWKRVEEGSRAKIWNLKADIGQLKVSESGRNTSSWVFVGLDDWQAARSAVDVCVNTLNSWHQKQNKTSRIGVERYTIYGLYSLITFIKNKFK